MTDHLGNTRLTFTTQPKTITFKVNYEGTPDDDQSLFEQVSTLSNDIFDHTDALGNTYTHTQMLNGMEGSRAGSVIAIPVGMGDTLNAKVYAKYVDAPGNPSDAITSLASSLIGAFTGGTGMTNEPGNQTINTHFATGSLIGTTGFPVEHATQQVGQPKNANYDELRIDDFVAPSPGYVLVYLSNENATLKEVYFDDLEIEVKEHPVIQTADYYPFGLQHSNGYQRITNLKNNFLFNAGSELNEATQNYMTPFRRYDPAIGRFNAVDAFTHAMPKINGYQFAFNDPIAMNDPTGLIAENNRFNFNRGKPGWSASSMYNAASRGLRTPDRGAESWINGYRQETGGGSGGNITQAGIDAMHNNPYGGTWSRGKGLTLFESHEEAAVAGLYHVHRDGGLQYTQVWRTLREIGEAYSRAYHATPASDAIACNKPNCRHNTTMSAISSHLNRHRQALQTLENDWNVNVADLYNVKSGLEMDGIDLKALPRNNNEFTEDLIKIGMNIWSPADYINMRVVRASQIATGLLVGSKMGQWGVQLGSPAGPKGSLIVGGLGTIVGVVIGSGVGYTAGIIEQYYRHKATNIKTK